MGKKRTATTVSPKDGTLKPKDAIFAIVASGIMPTNRARRFVESLTDAEIKRCTNRKSIRKLLDERANTKAK